MTPWKGLVPNIYQLVFGSFLDIGTFTSTSPKVPPKVITPTFALVDVDLFNDDDNIMTKIAVNLEHK
jgi:hypothetical protein